MANENINKSDISVVIPAYNCENTIKATLDSIYSQTGIRFIREVIVVNDGSTDGTAEVLEEYAKNVLHEHYESEADFINEDAEFDEADSANRGKAYIPEIKILTQKNSGVSAARNNGIKAATGKWIALCDSDDIWLRDKISLQENIINHHPEIDFLGGNHMDFIEKIGFRKLTKLTRLTVRDLCIKILPQTSTAIFKKEIVDNVGGYDESMSHAEDINFYFRVAEIYAFFYSPEQVVYFGNGKKEFGAGGLSQNIALMHKGFLKNFRELRERKSISKVYYIFACAYENAKYLRRKILTKIRL